ncbi:MAG: hypothetical protein GEU93_18195 [Propionibacteriales bacterium]|nr:hypothetical protein [Propionibacteriales bacterium]
MSGLIKSHPADGNKRTALLAAHVFYAINGFNLSAEASETVALALAVAQGYLDKSGNRRDVAIETIAEKFSGWAQPIKLDDDLDSPPG